MHDMSDPDEFVGRLLGVVDALRENKPVSSQEESQMMADAAQAAIGLMGVIACDVRRQTELLARIADRLDAG